MRLTSLMALLTALATVSLSTSGAARYARPASAALAERPVDKDAGYRLLSELVTQFGARPAGSAADHAPLPERVGAKHSTCSGPSWRR
jgi:hypothetical protein